MQNNAIPYRKTLTNMRLSFITTVGRWSSCRQYGKVLCDVLRRQLPHNVAKI